MDMVLKVCISDGSEIIIDGFDKIAFHNELPNPDISHSGYSWQKDYYYELLNNLVKYNFISIQRNDPKDKLEYRNHAFAFENTNFNSNNPLILRTNCISTIINMYL
ncbi:hypothetical protein POL88_15560 [Priestia megaterium]|uniref:hypothetical protein n=1 Tax=Priestia megaterium TaxID=1404 RepID=UPI00234FACAB|nr:hypothetical protein [Priestia megaterium]MDC7770344.1 hypothetical protein [Priestia megaterium]